MREGAQNSVLVRRKVQREAYEGFKRKMYLNGSLKGGQWQACKGNAIEQIGRGRTMNDIETDT